jgi:hypothetical protein
VNGDMPLDEADVEQFVYWNAVFNAWPYWRESCRASSNGRSCPRSLVPVMGVPRSDD